MSRPGIPPSRWGTFTIATRFPGYSEVSIWMDISDTVEAKLDALKEHKSLSIETGIVSFESVEYIIERDRL
jgi:hypothetical protein